MNVHADSSVDAEEISVTGYINDEKDGYDMSFTKGDSVTMKVKVTGVAASKVTYQWCASGDGALSGKTSSELTVTKGVGYESYYCEIYIDGEYWSWYTFTLYSTDTLSVSSSAKIDGEDCDLDSTKVQRAGIKKGTQVELSVSAESKYEEAELTYQWQKEVTKEDEEYGNYTDYENIKGATEPTYVFTKETEGKESYVCEISDGNTSQRESFYLPGKSTLTVTQKINDTNYTDTEMSDEGEIRNFYSTTAGTKLKLTVDVKSSAQDPELSYTWYGYDEDSCSSEIGTDSSCTVTKKTNNEYDDGSETYWCEVSDDTTTLTYYFYLELDSTLTLKDSTITIGEQKYDEWNLPDEIAKGTSVTLSVSAKTTYNDAAWTYQWQKLVTKENEEYGNYSTYENIEDATSADYSFETSGVEEDYRCIISDGNKIDYAFFIILGENTLTVTQAINGETYTAYDEENDTNYYSALKGKRLTLSVTASSSLKDAQISYEWYDEDSNEIEDTSISSDNKTSSCKITKGVDAERYYCKVSDGSRTNTYYFYLDVETTLTTEGIKATINGKEYDKDSLPDDIAVGTSITLSASATSTYPDGELTYQWQRYGDSWEDIEDATEATYSFEASGIYSGYHCLISDGNESDTCYITIRVADTITATQQINGKAYSSTKENIDGEEEENNYPATKGDLLTLSVTATSSIKGSSLSYTWYTEDDKKIGKTASLEITKDAGIEQYLCEVSDGSTVTICYFYLKSKDTLTVTQKINGNNYSSTKVNSEGEEEENGFPALKGDQLTLSIVASSSFDNDALSYTWYDTDWDETANKTSSYVITKGDGTETYRCEVSDGNYTDTYYFYLEPTDTITVTQQINDTDYTHNTEEGYPVLAGTNLKLSVTAETSLEKGSLSYTWYNDWNGDTEITDITTSADGKSSYCEITKEAGEEQYICRVSDGNRTNDYYFYLEPTKTISATQTVNGKSYSCEKYDDYYFAPKGTELTLSVAASTSLKNTSVSYMWHEPEGGAEINDDSVTTDATSSSCKVTMPEDEGWYCCKVTDGNEILYYNFYLKEGETETDPATTEKPKEDTGASTTAQPKKNTAKANTAKAAAATVLKNGTQVTDQKTKAVLKVTGKNTVTYVKSSNKKTASVTIPTSITKNGTKYTVTAIAPKAFYKNKKLKKVVIPKTVKKIGKQAFFGCKNLKKITIKTTSLKKKNVGAKAFKGIHKKATIKVPKKQKKAYKKILKARGIAKTVKVK